MMLLPEYLPKLKNFRRNEDGVITVYGLLLIMAFIIVGGLGLDYANGVRVKTHLQVAADSAAHAALIARARVNPATGLPRTEDEARAIAIGVAETLMPSAKYGNTILPQDIQFGTWDAVNQEFTIQPGSRLAVMVDARQIQSRGNAAQAFFWKLYDVLPQMDVISQSVFETYFPTCYREGFVSDGRIDLQSNNLYRSGFCLHSNSHIEVAQNNVFQNGVVVSMPNQDHLVLPNSGFVQNTGLLAALRSGGYHLNILQRINGIIAGYDTSTSLYYRPTYFDVPLVEEPWTPNGNKSAAADWVEGAIHKVTCNGNQTIRFTANEVFRNGVIETNCKIAMNNNTFENVLFISTNEGNDAFSGSGNITLGRNDNCAAGGGVQIVTRGGFQVAAQLSLYGAQILALKDVEFAANANGSAGVSIVTAGEIDAPSNMDMGFCGGAGMENNFEAEYFRMAT